MAVVSAAGLLLGSGGLYRLHRALFLGVTEAEAGLLLPGLLGQDVFNLLVGLPLLLGSPWLARGGALIGLLFYVPLVTLSAFTTISLVSSIDGENVWRRLSGAVPVPYRRGSSAPYSGRGLAPVVVRGATSCLLPPVGAHRAAARAPAELELRFSTVLGSGVSEVRFERTTLT